MKKILSFILLIIALFSSACSFSGQTAPSEVRPTITATQIQPSASFTPIPTLTLVPTNTPIPGTIVLDFAAQLCNAKWMNGGQKFEACPGSGGDPTKGYGALTDSASEGLPAGSTILLTVPATNGFAAFFLRYPALKIETGDHFRATILCQTFSTNCDVSFGLDYYDAHGKYHSPLAMWNQTSGMTPTVIDLDLSALAGQNVDLVLALRPNNDSPQFDTGLWAAPQVFRPGK